MTRAKAIDELKKTVNIETLAIFSAFCNDVVVNSDPVTGTRKKMSDIVGKFPYRDQSSITRILRKLNEKCDESFSQKLFTQGLEVNGEVKDKNYYLLPLGAEFLIFANSTINRFNYWEDANSRDGNPRLRIAVNTFSFHTLIKIENRMRLIRQGAGFERRFTTIRSNEIFDRVKHDPNIDVGIAESVLPAKSRRQLDVIELTQNKLVLITRKQLSSPEYLEKELPKGQENRNKCDVDGQLREEKIRKIPLLLGDTSNFLDLLIDLDNTAGSIKRVRKDLIKNGSQQDKKNYLTEHFNIKDMSSSINILLDIFLMGDDKNCMIVTEEVRAHIEAMNSNAYLEHTETTKSKNLWIYKLPKNSMRLKKYAIRKPKLSDDHSQISQDFWSACQLLRNENPTKGRR